MGVDAVMLGWNVSIERARQYWYQISFWPWFDATSITSLPWTSNTSIIITHLIPGTQYSVTVSVVANYSDVYVSSCAVRTSSIITITPLPSVPTASPSITRVQTTGAGFNVSIVLPGPDAFGGPLNMTKCTAVRVDGQPRASALLPAMVATALSITSITYSLAAIANPIYVTVWMWLMDDECIPSV